MKLVFVLVFFATVTAFGAQPQIVVVERNLLTARIESYSLMEQVEPAQKLLAKYPEMEGAIGYLVQETIRNLDFLNAIEFIEAEAEKNGDRIDKVSLNVKLFPDRVIQEILRDVSREGYNFSKDKATAQLVTELRIKIYNPKKQTSREVAVAPGLSTELSDLGTFAYLSYISPEEADVSNMWSETMWDITRFVVSFFFPVGCGSRDNGGTIQNLNPNSDSDDSESDPTSFDDIFIKMPGTMNLGRQTFCVCENPRTLEVTPPSNAKAGDQYHIFSVGPITSLKQATSKLDPKLINEKKVFIARGIAIEPMHTVIAEFAEGPHQLYAFTRRKNYPDTAAYGPVKLLITKDKR